MPIVIKEIRVNTVVEKKIMQQPDISEDLYARIKEAVLEELVGETVTPSLEKTKNDR